MSRTSSRQSARSRDYLETTAFPARPLAALSHLFSGMRLRLLGAGLVYVVKHSPVWVAPIVTAEIINLLAEGRGESWSVILTYAMVLLVLLVMNIPLNTWYVRLINGAIRSMESRTRMALIRRFQQLSFSFHGNNHSGALQNKVLRDVEVVGTMVTQIMNTIFSTLVTIVLSMVWTLGKKPEMALFFLLAVPVATVMVRAFRRPIARNAQDYRKALEGMTVRVGETLEMLPVTRAHAMEEHELLDLAERMDSVAESGRRMDVTNGLFGATSWVLFQVFSLVNLVVAGWLALQGQIPVGDVVLYQGFFAAIMGGVSGVLNVMPEFAKGTNALGSLGEVLRNPDREDWEGKAPVPRVEGAFSLESVGFRYPGTARRVLQGLDLRIEPGQTVAFVGESGSGKSTLMSLLVGFYHPTEGRILLDGADMRTLDLRQYRQHLSVVSQQVILFSGSIRDNVGYGIRGIDDGVIWAALEGANAADFVRAMPQGLDTLLGEHGSGLSGGQRQRLAIARAMVRNPRVLILDEATSALDVESERQVQEALERLVRGRTTLVVAHRLSTIRHADLVVVLEGGRVAEVGTHAELLGRQGAFWRISQASALGPVATGQES